MNRWIFALGIACMMAACSKPDDGGNPPKKDPPASTGGSRVVGTVTCDGKPLVGVVVSDGIDVVTTDENGKYVLDTEKQTGIVFVTPPSGYVPLSTDGIKPDFYARLKEDFSEEIHDFELREENQDSYSIIFLSDLHLTNADFKPDLQVFRETVMPNIRQRAREASAEGPVYSVNLGDLSHERWWYKYSYTVRNAYNTLVENDYPTLLWSVPGNHDNDSAVHSDDTDWDAGHMYREVLGPEYYSVNIGNEHWVFLDNIKYENSPGSNLAVGAAGTLDYSGGITDRQMKWLRRDIAEVPSDMNVIVCGHTTVISDNSKGYTGTKGQVDSIATMMKRFRSATFYNGHMHTMVFFDSKLYPGYEGIKIPATSGDMWESAPNYLLGCSGEDGGLYVVNFKGDERTDEYYTHLYGKKWMRLYDMNSVGEYYKNDPDIREQLEKYPKRLDYSESAYANNVMINYWMYKPGQTVEVYEDGKLLTTKAVNYEDPLFNVNYHIRTFKKELPIRPGQSTVTSDHMFIAKARTSTSPITVRVKDESGKLIHEETMTRPKKFHANMQ